MADEKELIKRIEKLEKEVESINKLISHYDRELLFEILNELKSLRDEVNNPLAYLVSQSNDLERKFDFIMQRYMDIDPDSIEDE